jgi:hypothetical protein
MRTKDFIDFRHNTQEEIDKFNQEVETNSQLNEVMDNNHPKTYEEEYQENNENNE